jgi:hypothetical protein
LRHRVAGAVAADFGSSRCTSDFHNTSMTYFPGGRRGAPPAIRAG